MRSPNLTLPNALSAHAPTIRTVKPQAITLRDALLPSFKTETDEDSDDENRRDAETELLEWLSMAMARSPRVLKGDTIDPYLCRYRPQHHGTCQDLVLYHWNGFAPAAFVQKILLAAMKASIAEGWFALGATAFSGEGYVILRDGGEVRSWRYSD